MRLVEGGEISEGVVADDIGVEHEKGSIVFTEDLFRELERAGGTKGFLLDGECDLNVEGFGILQ